MKTILFIAENVTLAHVARPLVLANSLDKTKYKVVFATGYRAKNIVADTSLAYKEIDTLSQDTFIHRLAKGHRLYTLKELKKSVAADLDLIRETSPDIIVGDFRLSLGVSSQIENIPYIAIVNAHWSPYSLSEIPLPEHPMIKLFGLNIAQSIFKALKKPIFDYHAVPFNKLLKSYGLKPLSSLQEIYSFGDLTLYPDIPELAPTATLPPTHRYIGPLLWSPNAELPYWWNEVVKTEQPIIYLTLGSSGNIGILDLLISFLKTLPVKVVIASADRFKQQENSSNLYYATFLPGEKVAPLCSFVICNGGSATAYQSLACGTPVLGFPSNTDQHFTMNAIVKAGAGISIRSEQANADNVCIAVNELINNPNYQLNSRRIKHCMDEYNAPENFCNIVESL